LKTKGLQLSKTENTYSKMVNFPNSKFWRLVKSHRLWCISNILYQICHIHNRTMIQGRTFLSANDKGFSTYRSKAAIFSYVIVDNPIKMSIW